ncbi:MAG: sulfate ABC transporter ATP-binding protein [Helicobacteraceae bacterium]|jgi:sulfate transport system ATP-binding protein|nr:sulfate ABC transporter ATP-binding protein [Helicobacteraceae bacterium]
MSIEIRGVSKKFGDFNALDNVNLTIETGSLTALLGPSGSGKTTLLRIIAGLESADRGEARFFGEDLTVRGAKDRGVGFVFQHYALFRHMSVFENVAFGLRSRPRAARPSKGEIVDRVMKLLSLVQLQPMANRLPSELSGGQKQRVALARALAVEPKILLLDEPFGALDAKVRQELRNRLRKLHDEIGVTSVFVTHDQEEALEVADQIVILNKGKIEQTGSPEEVYDRPANPFVYSFLGNVNLFHARRGAGEKDAQLYIRPHDVKISTEESAGAVPVRVLDARKLGARVKLELFALESGKIIEAEVVKDRWNEIRSQDFERLYATFANAKIYEGEAWNDYVI